MHPDLIDDETLALLNLLTETIENDRYPLSPSHPHALQHPSEVRPDGTGATANRPTSDTRRPSEGRADRNGLAILSLAKGIPPQSVAFV